MLFVLLQETNLSETLFPFDYAPLYSTISLHHLTQLRLALDVMPPALSDYNSGSDSDDETPLDSMVR